MKAQWTNIAFAAAILIAHRASARQSDTEKPESSPTNKAEAEGGAADEAGSEPEAGSETRDQPSTKSDSGSEPEAGSETRAQPSTKSDSGSEPEAGSETRAQPSTKSDTSSEARAGSETRDQPSAKSDSGSEPEAGSGTGDEPNPDSKTKSPKNSEAFKLLTRERLVFELFAGTKYQSLGLVPSDPAPQDGHDNVLGPAVRIGLGPRISRFVLALELGVQTFQANHLTQGGSYSQWQLGAAAKMDIDWLFWAPSGLSTFGVAGGVVAAEQGAYLYKIPADPTTIDAEDTTGVQEFPARTGHYIEGILGVGAMVTSRGLDEDEQRVRQLEKLRTAAVGYELLCVDNDEAPDSCGYYLAELELHLDEPGSTCTKLTTKEQDKLFNEEKTNDDPQEKGNSDKDKAEAKADSPQNAAGNGATTGDDAKKKSDVTSAKELKKLLYKIRSYVECERSNLESPTDVSVLQLESRGGYSSTDSVSGGYVTFGITGRF